MMIAVRISHPSLTSREQPSAILATSTLTIHRRNLTTCSRPILPALGHLPVLLRPEADPLAKILEHLRHSATACAQVAAGVSLSMIGRTIGK